MKLAVASVLFSVAALACGAPPPTRQSLVGVYTSSVEVTGSFMTSDSKYTARPAGGLQQWTSEAGGSPKDLLLRGDVSFALPPLLGKSINQPAALMYFAFFAVGVLTGTILTAGGKRGAKSGKSEK